MKYKTAPQVVPLSDITQPGKPMRTGIDEAQFMELVESIERNGLINPITVRKSKGGYEIVAGHRRYLALQELNWEEAPCQVITDKNVSTESVKFHENLVREDVKITDEAEHMRALMEERDLSEGDIANMIGKSKSYVYERLKILDYDDRLYYLVDEGKIKHSIARELNKIEDPNVRDAYINYVLDGGATVDMVKQWAQRANATQQGEPAPAEPEEPAGQAQPFHEHTVTCEITGQQLKQSETTLMRVSLEVYERLKQDAAQANS